MDSGNNSYKSYIDEENHYWGQLRQELERYKTELETTNVELAEGLGISRQSLVSFMKKPSCGLPIRRSNLMQLWDFLTKPERLKEKKLSEQARLKRTKLRNEGLNSLLKLTGFLPSPGYDISNIEPSIRLQIDEIAQDWFENLGKEIEEWFKRNPEISSDKKHELYQVMAGICSSGKIEFFDREIKELYSCIIENTELLNNPKNKLLNLKITNCEFTTLTFLIEDYINDDRQAIREELIQSKFDTERILRKSRYFDKIGKINDEIPPVIKVSVESIFKKSSVKKSSWSYASDKTHYENIYAAVAQAMGYGSQLELGATYTERLGIKDFSLVKAKIELYCRQAKNQKYQGEWVGRNTILCVLQATIIAATKWLHDFVTESNDFQHYANLFIQLVDIENELDSSKKLIDGYVFRADARIQNKTLYRAIKEKVIDQIEKIKKEFIIYDFYKVKLEQQYCAASLILARSDNVRGKIREAKQSLEKIRQSLQEIRDHEPTRILYEVQEMVWELFSGKREFLDERKNWINKQNDWLKRLQEYIKKGNIKYGNYPDSCDANVYDCASEMFGRIGRLDFRFEMNNSLNLENAVKNLLMAAYCSSRIGHRKRVAHWLANASRAYCRLGQKEKAKQLADLAQEIIHTAIEPIYSIEYRQSVTAEINLARAEIYLLIEQNNLEAIKYFLNSLKGSIYLEFPRLISESLYGIARASKKVDCSIKELFRYAFNNPENFNKNQDSAEQNKIVANVIDFLNNLDQEKDWQSVSDAFKKQAIKIWNDWFKETHLDEEGKHPIAEMMEKEEFLCRLQP